MRALVEIAACVETPTEGFLPGDIVVITHCTLAGMHGVVTGMTADGKVAVQLDAIDGVLLVIATKQVTFASTS